jgi:hypothetical protein
VETTEAITDQERDQDLSQNQVEECMDKILLWDSSLLNREIKKINNPIIKTVRYFLLQMQVINLLDFSIKERRVP